MNHIFRLQAAVLSLVATAAFAVPTEGLSPHHRLLLQGEGARTVIFESGLGDTLEVWQRVQPLVADGCTRTLAYNRAGYPGSDPAGGPRDAATIVAELRAELQSRNVSPPYVLVGHSIGGLYMQYFARNFPGEVAGLVLVDSTHWNQGMRLDESANTPYLGRSAVTLFMPWIMRRELSDSMSAGAEVHSSPEVGYLPTIVLSSTRARADETPSARSRAEELQDDIAADFPQSRHIRVLDSGHYIQRDQPDIVVEAVRELAGCATRGKGLAPAS
jgi:pimeloyl-ACP methyl ester carboxylesterase